MAMLNLAAQVDLALRAAGLPILGVSIGNRTDKTTWRVDFTPEATDKQRTEAAALISAFEPAVDVELAPITLEGVLTWCAGKFGVSPVDAASEVASGATPVITKP